MRLPLFMRRLLDRRGADPGLWSQPALCRPAKPRVRIRQDGWIIHPRGQPFPFHPKTIVETVMQGGLTLTGPNADYAQVWPAEFWTGEARSWKHNIIAYRIVEPCRARL
jgi:hypothetical protein